MRGLSGQVAVLGAYKGHEMRLMAFSRFLPRRSRDLTRPARFVFREFFDTDRRIKCRIDALNFGFCGVEKKEIILYAILFTIVFLPAIMKCISEFNASFQVSSFQFPMLMQRPLHSLTFFWPGGRLCLGCCFWPDGWVAINLYNHTSSWH